MKISVAENRLSRLYCQSILRIYASSDSRVGCIGFQQNVDRFIKLLYSGRRTGFIHLCE